MGCRKCGNTTSPEFFLVCDECYQSHPPTTIHDSAWVRLFTPREKERMRMKPENAELTKFILTSFVNKQILPDPKRHVVVVGGKLQVQVNEKSLDDLARKSCLLMGKWLVYKSEQSINANWNKIANSSLKGELGIDAKVSTARQVRASKEYVICVYTDNYLDSADVNRVRQRLRELGYVQKLYYKPDLYTYLNIYRKTFPSVKASSYVD